MRTFDFVNLPIGNYTIKVTHAGFQTLNIPSVQVQVTRTATVNATLKVGQFTADSNVAQSGVPIASSSRSLRAR